MHNIGWTQFETGHEALRPDHEQFLGGVPGAATGEELGVPLSQTQELELASELLEVASEQELEQFLGDVFHSVGSAVGQFMRSETAHALGPILKDAAGKALPVLGRAIGDRIAPVGGGDGRLAQAAGTLLGLELEGLSPQDQEFEAARQFVRFAGAAANQALLTRPTMSPENVARAAVTAAGHRFAPGLAHELPPQPHRGTGQRGYVAPSVRGQQSRRSAARRPDNRDFAGAPAPTRRPDRRYGARPGATPRPELGQRHGARPSYQEPQRSGRVPRVGGVPRVSGVPRYGGPSPARAQLGRPAITYARSSRPLPPTAPGSPGYGPGWQRSRQPYGSAAYGYGVGPSRGPGGESFYQRRWWPLSSEPYPPAMGAPAPGQMPPEWSQPMQFVGPAPPPAPPGAPGRWTYRGSSHGRRRWVWMPISGAAPFWPPLPHADAPAEPAGMFIPPGPDPFPDASDNDAAIPWASAPQSLVEPRPVPPPPVEPQPAPPVPPAQASVGVPPNGGASSAAAARSDPGNPLQHNGAGGIAPQGP
jgi:hypothetical protein